MRKAALGIGLAAACLHGALFMATFFYVQHAADPQAALIWTKWRFIDFPITLLYWLANEHYSQWLNSQNQYVAQIFYLPYLIHGALGTIWWFFLPGLVLPRTLGGVWEKRRKVEKNDRL